MVWWYLSNLVDPWHIESSEYIALHNKVWLEVDERGISFAGAAAAVRYLLHMTASGQGLWTESADNDALRSEFEILSAVISCLG